MAIEAVSATIPLKAGERLAGLNHVAELRARYWGDKLDEESTQPARSAD